MVFIILYLCIISLSHFANGDTFSWDLFALQYSVCEGSTCRVATGLNLLISAVWTFANPTENPRMMVNDVSHVLLTTDPTYFYICPQNNGGTGMALFGNSCNFTIKSGSYKLKTNPFRIPDLPGNVKESKGAVRIMTVVKNGDNPAMQTVWPEKTIIVRKKNM